MFGQRLYFWDFFILGQCVREVSDAVMLISYRDVIFLLEDVKKLRSGATAVYLSALCIAGTKSNAENCSCTTD